MRRGPPWGKKEEGEGRGGGGRKQKEEEQERKGRLGKAEGGGNGDRRSYSTVCIGSLQTAGGKGRGRDSALCCGAPS